MKTFNKVSKSVWKGYFVVSLKVTKLFTNLLYSDYLYSGARKYLVSH